MSTSVPTLSRPSDALPLAHPGDPRLDLPAPARPARDPRSLRPDVRRWHDGPTPVSLRDLVTLTREVAAEVAGGAHEVQVDAAQRWSRRLHADADLDIWLISWADAQTAELHDHGGSLGALTVVSGELTEWRWSAGHADPPPVSAQEWATHGPGLRRRTLHGGGTTNALESGALLDAAPGRDPGGAPAPGGAAFGLGHVHEVANRSAAPAVSVHAYSPPLSTMSYYEVEGGSLRRARSELVEPGQAPE